MAAVLSGSWGDVFLYGDRCVKRQVFNDVTWASVRNDVIVGHENRDLGFLVQVDRVWYYHGHVFMEMKNVGVDLWRCVIHNAIVLGVEDVMYIVYRMLDMFRVLYDRGILFHDLKPNNYCWEPLRRELTMIDFGSFVYEVGDTVYPITTGTRKWHDFVRGSDSPWVVTMSSIASFYVDSWYRHVVFMFGVMGVPREIAEVVNLDDRNPSISEILNVVHGLFLRAKRCDGSTV
jgi:hypothetical protein